MNSRLQPPSPNSRTSIDPAVERAVVKAKCERDHLFFSRYFFKHRQGIKFRVNWHHVLIADTVQRVIDGELKNVVINVPPGSSKTELVAINLIARGLALNPRARFLHISYSDDLALLNSETARDIVASGEYQALWPLAIADDAKSKKRWNVMIDGRKAGGVYAVSLGGQITGFRAGHMTEGWQGAIIIDDPLKVEDAYSKTARDKANRKLLSTVKSRKANPDTPIIVIMQRLAEEDPTGFIKAGKLPGDWEFIEIPALITDEYVAALPERVREMVEVADRDEDGRFSYWPYKEPLDDLLASEKADAYVFNGQYMQRPSPLGGGIIQSGKFLRYGALPQLQYRKIFADTAQKTAERNDYSVFECWGLGYDNRLYLIDLVRGKWKAPELKRRAIDFWNKHAAIGAGDPGAPVLRQMKVEDKSSGTGLIQEIQAEGGIPIEGIERVKDKLTRVMDVVSHIDAGNVGVPLDAPWVSDFLAECDSFTADDTHMHDDQIDPMVDAINDMLGSAKDLSVWERLAG
ncbi:phage terminase large subunit [Burkholderia multivorans]|uniref:phage terminase large subunit n=1 Tax=Burkholderia multivorans TaxID=87883 RepID=UPI00201A198F|nr:phage terminase large subunit [Burkholderia multivorans]MCO1367188.1 phage terminase large subunit [Burkholderia multivorans]MCO1376797.1 phage terminase large subunit [Burkholderia multivorans]UQP18743.1 phage terminase large subunit [Burkholderia multivorans]UQP86713.1 phage terminase large subunit [Burkholderia multivorans]